MNYKHQFDQIENQLQLLCNEKGIGRDDLYHYQGWTQGEQYVIMKLLDAKCKLAAEERTYGLQGIFNVVLLSGYRNKKNNVDKK